MTVLDPRHQRTAFTDALRPPAGYVLGACLGTTYSLDFEAFTAVVLAFVGAELEDPVHDAPSVLTTIARLRSRLRVFVNAGSLHPPRTPNRLFALYDRVLRPVHIRDGAFHPKVWALRFDPISKPERHRARSLYRVLCASRNVTDSGCWELGVSMNGSADPGTKQKFGTDVSAFFQRFARSRELPKDLWKLLSELPSVEFEQHRESVDELRFGWQYPGHQTLVSRLPKYARRAILISPFIRGNFVKNICERVDDLTVVSTQRELDGLSDDAHELLRRATTYVVTTHELEDMPGLDLHAKLLAWETESASETLLGSANATGAAWGLGPSTNCEAMVSLRPGLKVGDIVRAFVSPAKGQLHGWIEEYHRIMREPDADEEAALQLERIRCLLASDKVRGTYDRSAGVLVLQSGASSNESIPEYVAAEIVPLLQRDTHAWQDYNSLSSDGARFRNVPVEDLSAFALVRLRHRRPQVVPLEFGIQFELGLSDLEQDARDDAVNARLLDGVDPRALLMNVLRGLPAGAGVESSAARNGSSRTSAGSLLQHASIERIIEVCTADPSRIVEVDAVLRACNGSEDMATFREFWQVFQDALQQDEARRVHR